MYMFPGLQRSTQYIWPKNYSGPNQRNDRCSVSRKQSNWSGQRYLG